MQSPWASALACGGVSSTVRPAPPFCFPAPQGALVMPLMAQGFQMGLVKFVAITARKA